LVGTEVSKIITIQGINQFGEKYIRQERVKCPSVWDALKRLTYTAEETQDFAEWSSKCKWFYDDDGKWYNEEAKWIDNEPVGFTTAQLRELWEKERKEATEL